MALGVVHHFQLGMPKKTSILGVVTRKASKLLLIIIIMMMHDILKYI